MFNEPLAQNIRLKVVAQSAGQRLYRSAGFGRCHGALPLFMMKEHNPNCISKSTNSFESAT